MSDVQDSIISCKLPLGSISIANRLSNPFTFVASLPNFWENASDKLCAGSVDYLFQLSPYMEVDEEEGDIQSKGLILDMPLIGQLGNMRLLFYLFDQLSSCLSSELDIPTPPFPPVYQLCPIYKEGQDGN